MTQIAMATTGGAKAMLDPELGQLVPGADKADLVLYDLSAPWWVAAQRPGPAMGVRRARRLGRHGSLSMARVIVENGPRTHHRRKKAVFERRKGNPARGAPAQCRRGAQSPRRFAALE